MLYQVISAIIGVYFSCIVFDAPKKVTPYVAIVGGVSWFVYLALVDSTNLYIATFFSGVIVATISHLLARLFKMPVTVFFIPGFFPLVPGASAYRTMYWIMQGDMAQANHFFTATLGVAGMIALAIFTVDSLFRLYSHLQKYTRAK